MGKKATIGERLEEILQKDKGQVADLILNHVHIHVFPELKGLLTNDNGEKLNGRQKKDLLFNIVAHLVKENIFTQKQISEIAKCSTARISQILKEGRNGNKLKEQNSESE